LKEKKLVLKKCKIHSVFDFNFEKREDKFIFNFCRNKSFVLVTLDKDYMDDHKYPFNGIPGIIYIISGKNDKTNILICLGKIIEFLWLIPYPKIFIGDSKFQVSRSQILMKGRDCLTRDIKKCRIQGKDSILSIMKKFNYI